MGRHDPSRRRFIGRAAALVGLAGAGAVGLGSLTSRPSGAPSVDATAGALRPLSPVTTTPLAANTTAAPAASATTAPPPTITAAAAIEIAAICREAWGARPVAGAFTSHEIERLTIHHTAARLEDNSQAPGRVRRHQQYHVERGWPDLAYHFVVDAAGNLYEGRPVDAVGDTGTGYDPTGHFLVCCEGNFDEQEVSEAQLATLVAVLAWASATHNVSPETISGHRDWAATSCPGDRLYPFIADGSIKAQVGDVVEAGGAAVTVVCGDSALDRVAAIERGA